MKIIFKRNNLPESTHAVSWMALDLHGKVIGSDGDPTFQVFPRSAIKMIQVLPFLYDLAPDSLDPRELACACASHSGELIHTELVSSWLKRLNLTEHDLVCGAHKPFDESTAGQMLITRQKPTRLHNNCSGKHTAMLNYALTLGVPTESYSDATGPVQKNIQALMAKMSEEPITQWGIDGCGIPAWRMSLLGFAKMMANFGRKAAQKKSIENQVFTAFTTHPELTSGHAEFCCQIMQAFPNKLMVKVGAEGVMTAVCPEKERVLVLKVHNGNEMAAEVAIAHLLQRHIPEFKPKLEKWIQPALRNWAGDVIGSVDAEF